MNRMTKIRTKEEIETEIKKGEEFTARHLTSMFGDDNTKELILFKEIMNMFLSGKSMYDIEDFVKNIGGNQFYVDDPDDEDSRMHWENIADDYLNWLKGNEENVW